MTTEVKLPDGNTAQLRDSAELTNREVKSLRKAARTAAGIVGRLKTLGFDAEKPETWTVASELTDEEDASVDLFQRQCVVTRLESWTLERPKPVTPDDVDDLPQTIFAPLTVAAANISFNEDFEVDPDPKATTVS